MPVRVVAVKSTFPAEVVSAICVLNSVAIGSAVILISLTLILFAAFVIAPVIISDVPVNIPSAIVPSVNCASIITFNEPLSVSTVPKLIAPIFSS